MEKSGPRLQLVFTDDKASKTAILPKDATPRLSPAERMQHASQALNHIEILFKDQAFDTNTANYLCRLLRQCAIAAPTTSAPPEAS